VILIIESWMIVLGLANLLLFLIGILLFFPKQWYTQPLTTYVHTVFNFRFYIYIIGGVVILHLIEVNFLDSITTAWAGTNFAPVFHSIEDSLVHWFSHFWSQPFLIFFVFIYIILYPFTLWFTPVLCIMTNNKQALRRLALTLAGVYAIALPFYLFLPVTNVYIYYGSTSALTRILPTINHFFYTTTTTNNCFPSLHVATTILIAATATKLQNKPYQKCMFIVAVFVIIAVIYLSIHWLLDILGGILIAITIITLLTYYDRKKRHV
jgi:membrane-associated phospholipid phosphatase